jgi:hypothetical protein
MSRSSPRDSEEGTGDGLQYPLNLQNMVQRVQDHMSKASSSSSTSRSESTADNSDAECWAEVFDDGYNPAAEAHDDDDGASFRSSNRSSNSSGSSEEYVEVDPREKYKGAQPTRTGAPQMFVPSVGSSARRRSLRGALKVPRKLSFGRRQGAPVKAASNNTRGPGFVGMSRTVSSGTSQSESNLRVRQAVSYVQAPKANAVKNVAKSFESRGNLARAKARPVQVKYKAHARGARAASESATNPMYRS